MTESCPMPGAPRERVRYVGIPSGRRLLGVGGHEILPEPVVPHQC